MEFEQIQGQADRYCREHTERRGQAGDGDAVASTAAFGTVQAEGDLIMNNEQGTMNNGIKRFYFSLVLALAVLTIEIRRRNSSLQSLIILSYSTVVMSLVSLSKSNQYSVSAHSLSDIFVFTINSFLLMEYWASLRFAPIEVPERNNCLASVNSFFSSHKCLYRLYILIANLRLLSNAIFIFLNISNFTEKSKCQKTMKNEQVTMNNGEILV